MDRGAHGSRRGWGRPGAPREIPLSCRAPCPALALMLKPKPAHAVRHAPGHLPRHFWSKLRLPREFDGDRKEGVPRLDSHSPGPRGQGVKERTGGSQGLLGPDEQTALSQGPASGPWTGLV
uniref:Uncharacterized protein n=1 Tax=Rousettus aegyptiacus TaxID=9407 RepID=A0A7J8H257_ROUAE|nr:hypothetical protein HJG63_011429 [Rousettus aegyptiacus]